jgi:hypothetical protein
MIDIRREVRAVTAAHLRNWATGPRQHPVEGPLLRGRAGRGLIELGAAHEVAAIAAASIPGGCYSSIPERTRSS